jgi:hypothetical protein
LFVCGIALSRRADLRTLARLSGVAVGSLAVVALNPVGLGVLEAPFVVRGIAPYVSEWQRTDLLTAAPLVAALMIVATAVIWAVTRTGVTWSRLLLLAISVFLLWYAARLVVVAALVAAPLFASALDAVVSRSGSSADPARQIGRVEVLTITAAALVCSVVLVFAAPHASDTPGHVPLGLDPALDRLPEGTAVFNSYALGGWITWRHPDLDQYIDGLATPYSVSHVRDYVRADATDRGWYAVVLRSHAPVALLGSGSALADALEKKGWTSEGTSNGYVLLHRPAGRAPRD